MASFGKKSATKQQDKTDWSWDGWAKALRKMRGDRTRSGYAFRTSKCLLTCPLAAL
ncbi:MAG: hypothetical protein HHJ17_16240 [Rhodoferax sp.]|nr:hypothetical protein [Rhodoferax sp.]